MLTRDEAEHLACDALQHSGSPPIAILPQHTIERPFGWVFFGQTTNDPEAASGPARYPIILVNKYSHQVLFTSTAFFVQSCVDTYEAILKAQGNNWCLTLGPQWRGMRGGGLSRKFIRRELEKVGLCEITRAPDGDT